MSARLLRVLPAACCAAGLFLAGCGHVESVYLHRISGAEVRSIDVPSSVTVTPSAMVHHAVELHGGWAKPSGKPFTTDTTRFLDEGSDPAGPGNYGVAQSPTMMGVSYRIGTDLFPPDHRDSTPPLPNIALDAFATLDVDPLRWLHVETVGLGATGRSEWFQIRIAAGFGLQSYTIRIIDSVYSGPDYSGPLTFSYTNNHRERNQTALATGSMTVWPTLRGGVIPFVGYERTVMAFGPSSSLYSAAFALGRSDWVLGLRGQPTNQGYLELLGVRSTLYDGDEDRTNYRVEARLGIQHSLF